MRIQKITDCPELLHTASVWFSGKWKIPQKAYLQSMKDAISGESPVPQWYVATEETDDIRIIAGCGIIENDFHRRKDLTPNLCALYVERDFRCRGIAGQLLDFVCRDMEKQGIETLYLITDHMHFYERYGWRFLFTVEDDDGEQIRMYVHRGN